MTKGISCTEVYTVLSNVELAELLGRLALNDPEETATYRHDLEIGNSNLSNGRRVVVTFIVETVKEE